MLFAIASSSQSRQQALSELARKEEEKVTNRERLVLIVAFIQLNGCSIFSLQMPSSTGHHKVQNNAMKAYRKQRQYIYRHCQLCHVTTSCAVIVVVCILMLPMLELATEHVQLIATCYMNHVPPPCMTFSHTPLELPSLNNVLPAMVLQNQQEWSNIKCSSCTSPHSRVCRFPLSPGSTIPSGLGRRVVGVVVLLLLLMSGDIETNPGPVGECIFLML